MSIEKYDIQDIQKDKIKWHNCHVVRKMIKEYRIKRGYTLEKLAEICDISWRNLQRIENGKFKDSKFKTIAKILLTLNVSEKDIQKILKEAIE